MEAIMAGLGGSIYATGATVDPLSFDDLDAKWTQAKAILAYLGLIWRPRGSKEWLLDLSENY